MLNDAPVVIRATGKGGGKATVNTDPRTAIEKCVHSRLGVDSIALESL